MAEKGVEEQVLAMERLLVAGERPPDVLRRLVLSKR